jgi:hypothetical protein
MLIALNLNSIKLLILLEVVMQKLKKVIYLDRVFIKRDRKQPDFGELNQLKKLM